MKLFGRKDRVQEPKDGHTGRIYDYSTEENRIATAQWLFHQAKTERQERESEWKKNSDYYEFRHDTEYDMAAALDENGLDMTMPVVPDPYVMVETQIVPDIPKPEFHGRDDDQDGAMAQKREFAVRYLIEANRLDDLNTANERRLRKLGDAFWKAYWDESMPFGNRTGNIRIRDVSPEDIYPDPAAGPEGLQDCEYVAYVYAIHKMKFWRVWHRTLEKKGIGLDEILSQDYREQDGITDQSAASYRDDMIQVMEFWFRQPYDTKEATAGDVACTIQAGGVELAYIPRYWKNTWRQNKLFPFVHYWCLRDETRFWNRSEIQPILAMVDAADRELATGLFNDAMMANDVVVIEEGTLLPGEEFDNVPGSTVKVNAGRAGGIARLGGLHSGVNSLAMVEWLQEQIQRTNRNWDSNNGRETNRVTTASGLLQLRGDAEAQQKLKKKDRNAGFCRLYELLDLLALEFFDDNRLLFLGAQGKDEQPQQILYNSNEFLRFHAPEIDPETGQPVNEGYRYFPRIDVTVTAGDGLSKNPATTVEVLDKLAATEVTADNWQLLAAELEYLDIPQKQEILDRWREKFQPVIPPEVTAALEADPELLDLVSRTVAMAGPQMDPAMAGPQVGQPVQAAGDQPGMLDAAEPNRKYLL